MNIRGKVLRDADHCINGEREGQYGSPEDNFRKIAILWSDYIQLSHDTQFLHLTPADVAKMMVLFKLARSMGPQDKYDNYVDLIGYAACAAESKAIEDPSLIGFERVQHDKKDITGYNCHVCANNDTDSTEEPCLSCKQGAPNGSNFVPKNTINRVCTTCVNQFMDRDVEPCLSCDPKTKSNWKYEL